LVSHDRHLLRTTTDRFLLVSDGTAKWFDGDLDDYRDWLQQRRSEEDARAGAAQPAAESRRDVKRREAEARQRLAQQRKPLEQELKQLEKRTDELTREKANADTALADESLYANEHRDQLKALLLRQAACAAKLAAAEQRWLELQIELEQFVASADKSER
jgi:ATP-binding cassette, subfamily F, member 3